MNKNNSLLTRLFSHNIVLLILSFLLAFTIWFIINASSETDTNVTISGIPITIELSDSAEKDGLQVFNADDLTASVEVTGNRVTVGSLTSSDIQIVANQTGSIITPGTYTLPLSAKKSGLKTNYNIVSSVTPSTVTVYVDRLSEVDFDIENRLSVQLADSNHYASTSLSQNSVKVSGPETQVSQISNVVVFDSISADSDDTKTVQERIIYIDSDGNELELPLVTADAETVEATISVLPIKTVKLTVDSSSAPRDVPEITISPETVKIAGPQSVIDEIGNELSVGILDFSKLKDDNNKISYDISLPTGCKVVSGDASATVSVDLSSYSKATVTCKLSSRIDATKYSVDFNVDTVAITVYGPDELINSISSSDITVIADFTDLLSDVTNTNAVSLSVPLTVKLSSEYSSCWVYGSYSASVNVSMK